MHKKSPHAWSSRYEAIRWLHDGQKWFHPKFTAGSERGWVVAPYLYHKQSVHWGLDFSSCLPMTDDCYSSETKISDHMATVCSFMNSYSQKDPNEPKYQPDLVMWFEQYITVACSRKMYMQASSWPVIGVIHSLLSLEDNAILSAFDDHPPPQDTQKDYGNQSDKLLHELTEKTLDFIKDHHPLHNDSDQPLTFENILSWAHSPGESYLYQQATCIEFHHLLVAVSYCFNSWLTHSVCLSVWGW